MKTIYPEYRSTLNGGDSVAALKVPLSKSAIVPNQRIAAQSPEDGEVHVMPVQGNIYMLVADGTNITVSIGPDGMLLVNTGTAAMSDKILATLNQLANAVMAAPTPNRCFGAHCPGNLGLVQSLYEHVHQFAGESKADSLHRQYERCSRIISAATSGLRRPDSFRAAAASARGDQPGTRGIDYRARERAESHERPCGPKGVCRRPQPGRPTHILMSFSSCRTM